MYTVYWFGNHQSFNHDSEAFPASFVIPFWNWWEWSTGRSLKSLQMKSEWKSMDSGVQDRWRSPLPCIGLSWPLTNRHLLGVAIAIYFHYGVISVIFLKSMKIHSESVVVSNITASNMVSRRLKKIGGRCCCWMGPQQSVALSTTGAKEENPIPILMKYQHHDDSFDGLT